MRGDSSGSELPGRFTRLVDFYGEAGFRRIRAARVAVVGLGGVGSHAAVALLVDFDLVTQSSLNRAAVAGPADVGRPKAEVLAEQLARTCPDTGVETRRVFCDARAAPALFDPRPDWVIDAVDGLNPKVDLLEFCVRAMLPVASSMGASAHRDPTQLCAGDISETRTCPLARQVRLRLRRRGIDKGILCVWSSEPAGEPLPPDLGDRILDRGRVRNRLPSQITVPGTFGYALAALVLERIAGGATAPSPGS
jgi:tRNA A37 threonylcarbamoyladenosine dehydratase